MKDLTYDELQDAFKLVKKQPVEFVEATAPVPDTIEGAVRLTDMHGNAYIPPNAYQEKHARKLKQATFEKLYNLIKVSGVDWEEFKNWYDSDPLTIGDRVLQHRQRNANIRAFKERAKKMQEARRGKQKAQASK